jgi:hypothetical protein
VESLDVVQPQRNGVPWEVVMYMFIFKSNVLRVVVLLV